MKILPLGNIKVEFDFFDPNDCFSSSDPFSGKLKHLDTVQGQGLQIEWFIGNSIR